MARTWPLNPTSALASSKPCRPRYDFFQCYQPKSVSLPNAPVEAVKKKATQMSVVYSAHARHPPHLLGAMEELTAKTKKIIETCFIKCHAKNQDVSLIVQLMRMANGIQAGEQRQGSCSLFEASRLLGSFAFIASQILS